MVRRSVRRTLEVVPPVLAPRLWWGHVLALVLVSAAATLGFWQVEAWQDNRDRPFAQANGHFLMPQGG